MDDVIDTIVVGAGFSGLCVASRLKDAGCSSLVVLEKATSVGGTWRENRYPGCACDIPSILYSLSSAPKWPWQSRYGSRPEILAYLEDFATRNDLMPHIRFGAEVISAQWDDEPARWVLRLRDGSKLVAHQLVLAAGGLHIPNIPEIDGLEGFRGEVVHSANWREEMRLDGRRVGVIGSGASAVQIIPEIVDRVDRLLVFQRTPAWILPRDDKPVNHAAQNRPATPSIALKLRRLKQYFMQEILTALLRKKGLAVSLLERAALAHLHSQISDPTLRSLLTPQYSIGCKRILLSSTFYPALTRNNVALVTNRISHIAENSIKTEDGFEHPIDLLILATGFRPNGFPDEIEIRGRVETLKDAWSRASASYFGISTHGFPNLFLMCGPNTGLGHNSVLLMIEAQAEHVARAYRCMQQSGYARIEVREEQQTSYVDEIHRRLSKSVWQAGGCHSWYQNSAGLNTTMWPGISAEYALRARSFSEDDYVLERMQRECAQPEDCISSA